MRTSVFVTVACLASCSKSPSAINPPAKHEDRHEAAIASPTLHLDITIDGVAATWQPGQFEMVPRFTGQNHDGEDRDCWSLREMARRLVGARARVRAVIGANKKAIEAADWEDTTRTPIIHTTRRGALKFRWTDKDGQWDDAIVVKDVVGLDIVTDTARSKSP